MQKMCVSIFQKKMVSMVNVGEKELKEIKHVCYREKVDCVVVQELLEQELLKGAGPLSQRLEEEYVMNQSGLPTSDLNQYSQNVLVDLIRSYLSTQILQSRSLVLVNYPLTRNQSPVL